MRARGGAGQTGVAMSQSSGEEGTLCTWTPHGERGRDGMGWKKAVSHIAGSLRHVPGTFSSVLFLFL